MEIIDCIIIKDAFGKFICEICGRKFERQDIRHNCRGKIEKTFAEINKNRTPEQLQQIRDKITRPIKSLSCIHREEKTREVLCKFCGDTERLMDIYKCKIYTECSIFRTGTEEDKKIKICLFCPDLTNATPS